ncbi:MAG: TIGR00375 family protein [Candidatus Methanospirareceae archaeon]
MIINADLHIHSHYSAATSSRMDFPTLAKEASKKGIQLLGTGDCLHPRWLEEIREMEENEGIFSFEGINFVLTVEVEDKNRVHHLLILPSISKAYELREVFKKYSKDIDSDGRPSLSMSGAEIAEYARDAEALIGACHAFTPWTALYAYHNSLKECYGDMTGYVSFVELGLSADSSYADRIKELHRLTFLTNSDAHSPLPIRLAREFNRFYVRDMSFEELRMAIERKGGRKPILNVGVPPEEGKYNESACIKCFRHYTLEEAIAQRWECECGGRIKKGVKDRVRELADCDGTHPEHRPPYLHLIPLAEIIKLAVRKSVSSKEVTKIWEALLAKFGNEVKVLVDTPIEAFYEIDIPLEERERVIEAIRAFREGNIRIIPGGGGKYGVIELKSEGVEKKEVMERSEGRRRKQLSLLDF